MARAAFGVGLLIGDGAVQIEADSVVIVVVGASNCDGLSPNLVVEAKSVSGVNYFDSLRQRRD